MTGPVEWLEHQFTLAASARAKVAAGNPALTEDERAAMRSTSATPGGREIRRSWVPPQVTRWFPYDDQPGPDDWRAHP